MRAVLLALCLATPAVAQDGIPASPATILAVADSLPELRRMIADCAPDTVLPDDDASWAAMTDAVEAALWRGRQDPALVTMVLGRLATPAPGPADCAVATFRFSVVSSALPEHGGWPRTAARMFDTIGLPVPDPLPTPDRWQAAVIAATAAAEPFRQAATCGMLLAPEFSARFARRLEEVSATVAATFTDAGYAPDAVATLAATLRPESLADLRGRDRATVQADCAARQSEWVRTLQFGLTDDTVATLLQSLTAP